MQQFSKRNAMLSMCLLRSLVRSLARSLAVWGAGDPSGYWERAQQFSERNAAAVKLACLAVMGAELVALGAASWLHSLQQVGALSTAFVGVCLCVCVCCLYAREGGWRWGGVHRHRCCKRYCTGAPQPALRTRPTFDPCDNPHLSLSVPACSTPALPPPQAAYGTWLDGPKEAAYPHLPPTQYSNPLSLSSPLSVRLRWPTRRGWTTGRRRSAGSAKCWSRRCGGSTQVRPRYVLFYVWSVYRGVEFFWTFKRCSGAVPLAALRGVRRRRERSGVLLSVLCVGCQALQHGGPFGAGQVLGVLRSGARNNSLAEAWQQLLEPWCTTVCLLCDLIGCHFGQNMPHGHHQQLTGQAHLSCLAAAPAPSRLLPPRRPPPNPTAGGSGSLWTQRMQQRYGVDQTQVACESAAVRQVAALSGDVPAPAPPAGPTV